LPGSLDRAVDRLLDRCTGILSLEQPAVNAGAIDLGAYDKGLASSTEALALVHWRLSHLGASIRVGRRSTGSARRIERIAATTTETCTTYTLHLSAHVDRPGVALAPTGYAGPLAVGLDEVAVEHALPGLVLEADYLELVPAQGDEGEGVWIVDQLWTVSQGFHLPVGDDFGEPRDDSSEDEEDRLERELAAGAAKLGTAEEDHGASHDEDDCDL
jgi:hypothetical protein